MKLYKATQSPPKPAAQALAALLARLSEIRNDLNADQAEIRRIDQHSAWRPEIHESVAKLGREGRELLNGAVEGLLPPLQNTATEQIKILRHRVDVAGAALEQGEKVVLKLQAEAAEERYRLRADDVKAAMADIVDAVLALEEAFQRRDALLKEIKPLASRIPAAGWTLLGRIGRSESMAYRFMQMAAASGWISEEKFNAAVKQSSKAMS